MKQANDILNLISDFEKRESELKLDIAQLKNLNDSFRIAEEKSAMLNSIIESSEDAIISKDLNGIINSWNASACRIFGYSAEEMIGQSILKLIPEERWNEESLVLEQLKKGIRLDHFETQRKRKNGSLVEVSLTISPMFDTSRKIIGISKIARDITMNRAAQKNSEILSAIIASSDDAIISKDLNSIITSWNEGAQRIFGYNAEEMIGQSIFKLIPEDRHDEEPKILAQLKQGIRVDHFETQRLRKDGTLIHVSLTISPIKDHLEKVVGLSKIARDITDKKLLDKKKDEFIGFVSHELKTPLTSLRSYIQVAQHKCDPADSPFIANALAKAEQQTKKMENMIADFLNISKFENGGMKITPVKFDIVSLISQCIEDARITSSKHAINYEGPSQLEIFADNEKISLVLVNLISNAQKYSPTGGKIKIWCTMENGLATISVNDKGIGISKGDQRHMFEKFFRASNEQTKFISGFGIGLYLASTILSLHGSVIHVESELGQGSTFSFSLPAM